MNHSDATITNEKQDWIEGVQNEFKNLVDLNSFMVTNLPKNRNVKTT